MLTDVLVAISASDTDRAIVITASAEVRDLTFSFGFEVVNEHIAMGHSAAVNRMTLDLRSVASRLLSIPSDLPTLQPGEIDAVLDFDHDGLILLPSRDQAGTNGVLMKPDCRIEMDYGPNSLERHRAAAAARLLSVKLLDVPGIQFDVDTPNDLFDLIDTHPVDTHTWTYLSTSGLDRTLGTLS